MYPCVFPPTAIMKQSLDEFLSMSFYDRSYHCIEGLGSNETLEQLDFEKYEGCIVLPIDIVLPLGIFQCSQEGSSLHLSFRLDLFFPQPGL